MFTMAPVAPGFPFCRWWEARTQLGQLYINVRSVMRMVSSILVPYL